MSQSRHNELDTNMSAPISLIVQKNMKAFGILLSLLLLTLSCRPLSRSEAHQVAQAWFDNSFTKCDQDYFSKYHHEVKALGGVYVNKYGTDVNEALFQFKNLSLVFEDKQVTSTEKLNGIEAKGEAVVRYTQFRYYDGGKWSSWEDIPLVFSGKLMKAANDLTGRPNSPMYLGLEKGKNGWSGQSSIWNIVSCSELPPL